MTRRCRAFTLVETAVWMALLAVLASLSGVILVYTGDAARGAGCRLDDASGLISVLDRLGRDCRAAAEVLDADGSVKRGPTCLILRLPGVGVVVWRSEAGVVSREAVAGARRERVPVGLASLVFPESPAGRVDVILPSKRGDSRLRFYLLNEEAP